MSQHANIEKMLLSSCHSNMMLSKQLINVVKKTIDLINVIKTIWTYLQYTGAQCCINILKRTEIACIYLANISTILSSQYDLLMLYLYVDTIVITAGCPHNLNVCMSLDNVCTRTPISCIFRTEVQVLLENQNQLFQEYRRTKLVRWLPWPRSNVRM